MSTVHTGSKGEDIACKYLQKLGYKILERNFRIRGGEIDIIARDKDILVFVEVKTRYSHDFGLPIDSITPWKIKFLKRAALFYVVKIKWGDKPYRLDYVGIDFACPDSRGACPDSRGADDSRNPKIELIKNITG